MGKLELLYTKHIIEDSSRRIPEQARICENTIKKYYKELFYEMYYGRQYQGIRTKLFSQPGGTQKLICGNHKFVFRKKSGMIVLITYIYKTSQDKKVHNIINQIRYAKYEYNYGITESRGYGCKTKRPLQYAERNEGRISSGSRKEKRSKNFRKS